MMPLSIPVGRMYFNLDGNKWDRKPLPKDYGRPAKHKRQRARQKQAVVTISQEGG